MTNKEFYAFCRDQRKVESNPHKRAALADMYNYLWECGISKRGVAYLIEQRQYQQCQDVAAVAAYQWLSEVFAGSVPGANIPPGNQPQRLW